MHPHFRAVASAQHGAVVDQGYPAAQPCGREGGADARHASARHHQVVALVRGHVGGGVHLAAAEGGQRVAAGGRQGGGVGGEVDGVAPAVEAREVVQGQRGFACPHAHPSGGLPLPGIARGAQRAACAVAVDRQGECAGAFAVVPGRGPVVRAHVHVVRAVLVEAHRGACVGHGLPHAVCHEVGRPHEVHELLVEHPAAFVAEALGFHPHVGPAQPQGRKAQQEEEWLFHRDGCRLVKLFCAVNIRILADAGKLRIWLEPEIGAGRCCLAFMCGKCDRCVGGVAVLFKMCMWLSWYCVF